MRAVAEVGDQPRLLVVAGRDALEVVIAEARDHAARSTRTAHSSADTLSRSVIISVLSAADAVKLRRVIARDLLLDPLRQPTQVLPQRAVRVRPDAVRMRIVRTPDDVVLADE